ncbi:TPA: protein phosphatase 2C [Bacillus pseudomycoides]|nr:protein phosphatase 2C [Bacillus pseudomycoides]
MLKKLKKFMFVTAAAVMLSVGFATYAPKEASAHWADKEMNWAYNRGIITADLRDSLATRQDAWLMTARYMSCKDMSYEQARRYLMNQGQGMTDGTRGTNWITRNEYAAMLYKYRNYGPAWYPDDGFETVIEWAWKNNIYNGGRGNDFATRAEIVTMLYNAAHYRHVLPSWCIREGD